MVSFDNPKSVNCSIRKDIDVNEHGRLSHFPLKTLIKSRATSPLVNILHSSTCK